MRPPSRAERGQRSVWGAVGQATRLRAHAQVPPCGPLSGHGRSVGKVGALVSRPQSSSTISTQITHRETRGPGGSPFLL